MKAAFDRPPAEVDGETIFDHLLKSAPAGETLSAGHGSWSTCRSGPNSVSSTSTYLNSYVAHAPMETHSALATVEGDKVTVWASTQTPFRAQSRWRRRSGLAPEERPGHHALRRRRLRRQDRRPQAVEAARLAKITGRPVQVVWSRAEEFFYDTFGPAAVVKIRVGRGRRGKIVFWDYDVYCRRASAGGALLRHPPPSDCGSRRLGGDRPEPAPVRRRRLARARGQHQHLRPRIAHST